MGRPNALDLINKNESGKNNNIGKGVSVSERPSVLSLINKNEQNKKYREAYNEADRAATKNRNLSVKTYKKFVERENQRQTRNTVKSDIDGTVKNGTGSYATTPMSVLWLNDENRKRSESNSQKAYDDEAYKVRSEALDEYIKYVNDKNSSDKKDYPFLPENRFRANDKADFKNAVGNKLLLDYADTLDNGSEKDSVKRYAYSNMSQGELEKTLSDMEDEYKDKGVSYADTGVTGTRNGYTYPIKRAVYPETDEYEPMVRTLLKQKKTENRQNEINGVKARYDGLTSNPDFAEKSKEIGGDNDWFAGASEETKSYFTEDEKSLARYLYNTGRDDEYEDYSMNYLKPVLKLRIEQASSEKLKNTVNEIPITSSVLSVITKPVEAVEGAVGFLKSIGGAGADDVAAGQKLTQINQQIRSTVTENINSDTGKFLYGVGMSMADVAWNFAVSYFMGNAFSAATGGNEAVSGARSVKEIVKNSERMSLVLMSSEAASNELYNQMNALAQSGEDTTGNRIKALVMSGVAGFAEYITEKFSIEAFLGNPKGVLTTLLKNAAAEGAEEIASDVINTLADDLLNGGASEINLRTGELMASGMSKEQASRKTLTEWLKRTGEDGLAGAVSGLFFGLFSAGSEAYSVYKYKHSTVLGTNPDTTTSVGQRLYVNFNGKKANVGFDNYGININTDVETESDVFSVADDGSALVKVGESYVPVSDADTSVMDGNIRTVYDTASQFTDDSGSFDAEKANVYVASYDGSDPSIYNSSFNLAVEIGKGNITGDTANEIIDNAVSGGVSRKSLLNAIEYGNKIKASIMGGKVKGNSITVSDIKNVRVDNGEVIIDTKDGGSVASSETNITDERLKSLIQGAVSYPSAVASRFVSFAYGKSARALSYKQYSDAFAVIYRAGRDGMDMSVVSTTPSFGLLGDKAQAVYELGVKYRNVESGNSHYRSADEIDNGQDLQDLIHRKRSPFPKGEGKEAQADTVSTAEGKEAQADTVSKGVDNAKSNDNSNDTVSENKKVGKLTDNTGKATEEAKAVLQLYSEAFGIDIELENELDGGGIGEFSDIARKIRVTNKNTFSAVLHESGHSVARYAPEQFRAIRDGFREYIIGKYGASHYKALLDDAVERYGEGKGGEWYEEEVVCDALVALQKKKGFAEDMAKTLYDRGYSKSKIRAFFKSVAEFLKKVSSFVKSLFDNEIITKSGTYAAQSPEYLDKLSEQFFDGMKRVAEFVGEGKSETRQMMVGKNKDGIEVYETSNDILNLTWKQRVDLFEDKLVNEYSNKKARFTRNGHTYYAGIDKTNPVKSLYGENRFSRNGKKAYIKSGADGDYFNLIENVKYDYSSEDRKNHKLKDGFTDYFDYFVKTIQIDNKVFDINVTVKKHIGTSDGYFYTLYLYENKNTKASPAVTNISGMKVARNASTNSIPEKTDLSIENDKKYLSAVKSGDMATARAMVEQAARDKGYTYKMYHGAKKGKTFTVFRDWQYFTENKKYAERYTGNNSDNLYSVFVKSEMPFDTRQADTKKIFESIRQEYGLTDLSNLESGLPDWTDGYDISEYIEENDLPYDMILLDEGGDLVDGKPVSRGISYVVRNSSQIKSADTVTYDDNGDIIPLSKRFNENERDIRNMLPSEQAELDKLKAELERKDAELAFRFVGEGKSETRQMMPDISIDDIVDLSNENELTEIIGDAVGASKYKLIAKYILDITSGKVTFSDGVTAIIDKRDAAHIAHDSANKKTAEISAIDSIINKAVYYAVDNSPIHKKFDSFKYYIAFVKYNSDTFPIYFNLGHGKNDSLFHLYDVTHQIKDTAHRVNDVGRLREFRPENGIFANSIPEKTDLSIENDKKYLAEDIRNMLPSEQAELDKLKAELERKDAELAFHDIELEKYYNAEIAKVKADMQSELDRVTAEYNRKEGESAMLVAEGEKAVKDIKKAARKEIDRLTAEYNGKMSEYALLSSEREKHFKFEHDKYVRATDKLIAARDKTIETLRRSIARGGGDIVVSFESVKDIVRSLNEKYTLKLTNDDVSALTKIYSHIANAKSTNSSEFNAEIREFVEKRIIPSSYRIDDSLRKRYKGFLSDMRSGVRLNDNQASELCHLTGKPWGKARSAYFGRIMFSRDSGTWLDDSFAEWIAEYPELFPNYTDDISDADEVGAIIEAVESLKAQEQSLLLESFSDDKVAVQWLTNELFEEYFNAEDVKSVRQAKSEGYAAAEMKYRAELSEYKKQAEKEIKSIKEQKDRSVKDFDKYRERTERNELRRKIDRLYKYFSDLVLHPTKTSYAPEGLYKAVCELCETIDITHNYNTALGWRLANLNTQYAKLAECGDSDYMTEYDESLKEYISELQGYFNGKSSLLTMSNDDLKTIYNLLYQIKGMVVDARKQIDSDERMENLALGSTFLSEQRKVGKHIGKVRAGFVDVLSSMRAIKYLSGYENGVMARQFKALEDGQLKGDMWAMEAKRPFEVLQREDKGRRFRRFTHERVETHLQGADGRYVKLTHAQIVQIIMTSEREKRSGSIYQHLFLGGIKIPDQKALEAGKRQTALENAQRVKSVRSEDVLKLIDLLDDYDKQWIIAAQRLFNKVSPKALDEVMFKLQHRHMLMSSYYIPFVVDKNFVVSDVEALSYNATLENAGIFKEARHNAPQPLIIAGIDSVINDHIKTVSAEYGLAIPLRNLNKIYNVAGVKDYITSNWHNAGGGKMNIVEQVMTDLQKNRNTSDPTIFDSIYSGYVRAVLVGNISVTLKQAASYETAGIYLRERAMLYGRKRIPYVLNNFSKVCDEIDKYTPMHYNRRLGLSHQELGNMAAKYGLWEKKGALQYIKPEKWIQFTDCYTTALLWEASKKEVEMRLKGEKSTVEVGSEEYFKQVAQLYNCVITDTQPMYDVLHRTELMKKNNLYVKSLLMFKTVPFQDFGVVADALGEAQAAQRHYKENNSKENRSAKNKAMRRLGRAGYVTITAAAVLGAITVAVAFLLRRDDDLRDEYGDISLESALKAWEDNILSGIISTAFPFSPVGSYGVSDAPVNESISVFWNSITGVYETIEGIRTGEIKYSSFGSAVKGLFWRGSDFYNLAKSVAQMYGIPLDNAAKLVDSVVDWANTGGGLNISYERNASQYYQAIYDNYMSGERDTADSWYKRARDAGYSPADIDTGLKKLLSDSEEIEQLGDAYLNSEWDTYDKIKNGLLDKGFTEKQIFGARNTYINSLTEKEDDPNAEGKEVKEYTADKITEVILSGDDDAIIRLADWFAVNGSKSSLTRAIKETYINSDDKTKERIESTLIDWFGYEDKTFNDWNTLYQYSDLYDAIKKGDGDMIDTILENFSDAEKSDKGIRNQVTKNLKEYYRTLNGSERLALQKLLREKLGYGYDYNFNAWLND